jgi:hypothetical protein
MGTDIGKPFELTVLSEVPGIGTSLTGCVAIAGKLRVDQDFLFNSADVRMQPRASIIVDPGVRLTIDNGSHLHGCSSMWEGITVWGGLTSKGNSIIEDAIVAVKDPGGGLILFCRIPFSIGTGSGLWAVSI